MKLRRQTAVERKPDITTYEVNVAMNNIEMEIKE
jgi:hypothetical protein